MDIIHPSQIKAIGTRHYRIKVISPSTGAFLIEDARTGHTSPLYYDHNTPSLLSQPLQVSNHQNITLKKPTHFYAFKEFLEAFNTSPRLFNTLCKQETQCAA